MDENILPFVLVVIVVVAVVALTQRGKKPSSSTPVSPPSPPPPAAAPNVINLNSRVTPVIVGPGATVSLMSDGSANVIASGQSLAAAWLSQIAAGNGAAWEVLAESPPNNGVTISGALDTWSPMNQTRSWGVTKTGNSGEVVRFYLRPVGSNFEAGQAGTRRSLLFVN